MSAAERASGEQRRQRILDAIRALPSGCVVSYATIARRAGLPRAARLVARVLASNDDPELPWHRVLRADGCIAFPPDSPAWREQRDRLRAEGVELRGGRVRMRRDDDLHRLLWNAAD